MPSHPLTVQERRQIVYSSVLRYAPEAIPLRQRVLDQVILGALIGSTASSPFRVETLLDHLAQENGRLGLRRDVVESAIKRLLTDSQLVEHPSERGRPAYHLSSSAEARLDASTSEIATLISAAFQRHFRDLVEIADVPTKVFRHFVMECFARYGRTLALGVAGRVTNDVLLQSIDARDAARSALAAASVRADLHDTVTARCLAFIRSCDPIDERLKFLLAQGYYFTQLLGVEEASFSPLAEHAFSGAVFYLDTNVIIAGLLPSEVDEEMMVEVLAIARRIGIEIRVTRSTIEELHFVVTRRVPELRSILAVLPEEVLAKTNDQIIQAFLHARHGDSHLTPDAFLDNLNALEARMRDEWQITVDEQTLQRTDFASDAATVSRILQEEALNVRGYPKHPSVLAHDVALYQLIEHEREANPLTWFLTRDKSLPSAAERLQPGKVPFCFSQIAMLQSISPFVTSAEEEFSFVDVFGSLMADQFSSMGMVLDVSEMMLLVEYHEDVMATPPDQLLMALDFVKSRTLHGRRYTESEIPQVSLELKKFLACDRETQIITLRDEQNRLLAAIENEQRDKVETQAMLLAALRKQEDLEAEVGGLRTSLHAAEQTGEHRVGVLREELNNQKLRVSRRVSTGLALLGVSVALIIWRNTDYLADLLLTHRSTPALSLPWIKLGLRTVGTLFFVIPPCRLIAVLLRTASVKITASGAIIALALWLSGLLNSSQAGDMANYLAVGTVIAAVALSAWYVERE